MGIRRTGGLVPLTPTGLRGMSWDILHVEPVPASGIPTLAHLMRPRSEKKGTICLSGIGQHDPPRLYRLRSTGAAV